MADPFEAAMRHTFGAEGGWANDPADRGGPTNLGITLGTLKSILGERGDFDGDGHVDADDLRLVTREQAREIYREHYWCRPGLFAIKDPRISAKVFDFGVNAGPRVAIAHLQLAVNAVRPGSVRPVDVDGVLGAQTLTALDRCDADLVISALIAEQKCFYLKLVDRSPSQAKFLRGWLTRAEWDGVTS